METNHLPGRIGLIQQAQDLLRLRLGTDPLGPLLCLSADSLLAEQL